MNMNKAREGFLLIFSLSILVLSADLFASDRGRHTNSDYDYAQVISAQPIVKMVRVSTPREECWQEEVAYRDGGSSRHDHGAVPVLGAVLGGAFGNAVGHSKRNKQVGSLVGAVLGASLAASASSRAHRPARVTYVTEERCRVYQDYREEERILGYRVKYRYNERNYTTRMDRDPGDRLKVRLSVSPVI